ncbi:uncharacterized protein FFC1_12043 [Fusarium fujikuroi]|nr:uncharacterized protein FFC1_12043 [Fusarium fujikuroi]
MLERPP